MDTEYFFYSIYAELPKTLAFVSGFYNPIARYWKQMVDVDRAKYCALDCYNTLISAKLMMDNAIPFDYCGVILRYAWLKGR